MSVNTTQASAFSPNQDLQQTVPPERPEESATLPPMSSDPEATLPPAASGPGEASGVDTVPGYEILGELGRGGMGVVYKARQVGLNRLCALKMILAGGHAGEEDLARFRIEAEAIARLAHPNIVAVYDIGTHEGKPYFSLEYCAGGSLDRKLSGTPIEAQEAAKLVKTLAEAMQAAHEANVIHRDLKPANVLLASPGRESEGSHTPKITDFGLAKKLDDTSGRTQTGAIMGTPSYMAPEQASGLKEIGPSADVYALGAILYDCLTGRPPFRAATSFDTIMQVVGEEPVPPTQLNAKVPKDVETITLKCLAKEPGKRYGSARELGEDLGRWLAGEPIKARPVGRVERAAKWVRRHKVISALAALVVLLLTVGVVTSSVFAYVASKEAESARTAMQQAKENEERANREKRRAETQLKLANWLIYSRTLSLAQGAFRDGDGAQGLRYLQLSRGSLSGWELDHLASRYDNLASLKGHSGTIRGLAFSPDGKRIVSASLDGTLNIWDSRTLNNLHKLTGHSKGVRSVTWSVDGKFILSESDDETVKVWDASTYKIIRTLPHQPSAIHSGVVVSPDGKQIVVSDEMVVSVCNLETGQVVWKMGSHKKAVTSVAWSRDGKHIISGSLDNTIKLWDAQSGNELHTLTGHTQQISSLAFSPNGNRIISGSFDGTLKMWDALTGKALHTLVGHNGFVLSVDWSSDGKRIVSGGRDSRVFIWNADTAKRQLVLMAHSAEVYSVQFSPNNAFVVSGDNSGWIRLWDAKLGQEVFTALENVKSKLMKVTCAAWSPDSKRYACSWTDQFAISGVLQVWNAEKELKEVHTQCDTKIIAMAWAPDSTQIASGGRDVAVTLRDAPTGKIIFQFNGHDPNAFEITSIVFSPDSRYVISSATFPDLGNNRTPNSEVLVWERRTGRIVRSLKGHEGTITALGISTDGNIIAGSIGDRMHGGVILWDSITGMVIRTMGGPWPPTQTLAFSPDSQQIATGHRNDVMIWDVRTGNQVRVVSSHTREVTGVAFHPDGRRIVTCSHDKSVKLWNSETGLEALTLKEHTASVITVAFSPDGMRLFSGSDDGTLKIYSVLKRQALPSDRKRYHESQVVLAEKDNLPFAAAFHLGRLLRDDPDNADLIKRHQQARKNQEAIREQQQVK